MALRLALILALVLQPLIALGGLPCAGEASPVGTPAAVAEPCCCPMSESLGGCSTTAEVCGCAPSQEPSGPADGTPPEVSGERLLHAALLAGCETVTPRASYAPTLHGREIYSAFAGGSAQSLLCVWRT